MKTFSVSTWVGFGQTCSREKKEEEVLSWNCVVSLDSLISAPRSLPTVCFMLCFLNFKFIYLFVPPHLCPFPLSALCVEAKPQFPIARFFRLIIYYISMNSDGAVECFIMGACRFVCIFLSNIFHHIRWICADGSLENIRLQERRVSNAFACSNRFPSVF
jgi:hypothetical protein